MNKLRTVVSAYAKYVSKYIFDVSVNIGKENFGK